MRRSESRTLAQFTLAIDSRQPRRTAASEVIEGRTSGCLCLWPLRPTFNLALRRQFTTSSHYSGCHDKASSGRSSLQAAPVGQHLRLSLASRLRRLKWLLDLRQCPHHLTSQELPQLSAQHQPLAPCTVPSPRCSSPLAPLHQHHATPPHL